MAKVEMVTESGCWLWTASVKPPKGYGQIGVRAGVVRCAHAVSYELFVGPIPLGLEIDHLCRVTCCVNPKHLEAVTHLENMHRSTAAEAVRARHRAVTNCPRGHPYSQSNTYLSKRNSGIVCRSCLTCRRDYQTRRRANASSLQP